MSQPYFPIDELFIELLCSIFELCCEVEILETRPLDEKIEDKIDVIQRCSPLTLVHVSQRWRTAGLQLRPIWSFIRVKDNTPLSKIRFWLDRSGNHPLSIVIDEVDPYRLLDAYNLLVPHAERWAEFRILAGESSIGDYPDRNWRLVPLLKRTNEQDSEPLLSAPILTVLHLQRRISMLLLIDRTMSYPSFHSAVLQKLTVVRINFEWSHLAFYGTLSGITELEVDQSFRTLEGHRQFMQSISLMTSLKYLRVHVGFSLVDISLESIAYPMTLPDLQELALRIYGPSALFWAWMSNLNASCLWYLYLEHHIPRGSLFDEEPVQQLGQAELASLQAAVHLPSLTHFHCELEPPLHSGHPKNLDMVAFMPAINTISKMTLFSWSGTRTFLKFLTFDCTFPQLQHVKFIGILNDPQEDVPKLKGTITRLCPSAIVTFEE